jgi:hypothetical protein
MRHYRIALRLVGALGFFAAGPAIAADVIGKWFTQTGGHVITIYKAGPQYAADIPITSGVIPGGSPHAPAGNFRRSLNNFRVMGHHVHFLVREDDTAPGAFVVTWSQEYDLNLSPEGQRLIGTVHGIGPMFPNRDETSNVTLFLRK